MPRTILIVDDEKNILVTLSRALEVEGYEVEVAGSARLALRRLQQRPIDAILMDVKMPEMDGLEALEALKAGGFRQPVIMMSGHGTIDTAVQAVRNGAVDFIEKPVSTARLLVSLENALRMRALSDHNAELRREAALDQELLGSGPAMKRLRSRIAKAAPSEGRVLITGENGTGKELVARAIHAGSPRAKGPFVKVNCAAIPSELIESELFGHERGAFTGAVAARKGKFELADGGSLFLDEVGDMPPPMQAKLLRVLQEGEFERVGGDATLRVDVRVIAATNRNLEAMVEAGDFREDLYYRLNVVPIHTPPLRERKEDIPILVQRFLEDACERNNRRHMRIDPEAVERLGRYEWPGNVRELRNVVERLVILSDGECIEAADVEDLMPTPSARRGRSGAARSLYRPGAELRTLVAEAERAIIAAALAEHGGNMSETARALGLERSHLYKKCKALGVDRSASTH
ncbi:MAG: sigma-54-dependent Fis family transcriptional regulator [Deltaproteobacteria bacterium]|nr:MAG: sigma-54-dependent Fis family transcriptional regulator [Deltaproteobacteria bacterium]